MSDQLKAALARIVELERQNAFLCEQSRAKDFVITNLFAQLSGRPVAAELPEFMKNLTPPPADQTKGGSA